MAHHNHFLIRNDSSTALTLNIEPEGAFFLLQKGEEVWVFDEFKTTPISLRWTISDQGAPIVSLWPGDGEIRVEKGGIDVFDLLQQQGKEVLEGITHPPRCVRGADVLGYRLKEVKFLFIMEELARCHLPSLAWIPIWKQTPSFTSCIRRC